MTDAQLVDATANTLGYSLILALVAGAAFGSLAGIAAFLISVIGFVVVYATGKHKNEVDEVWYCPKKNLLFTRTVDSEGWSASYPNGISRRKVQYPEKTGCIYIGRYL